MCRGSAADLQQQAAAPLAAAVAAVEAALVQPSTATDLPDLLSCLETAASIALSASGAAEADTDCQAQLQRLPQLAAAALQSPAVQSDPAALLPAVRLCVVAAQAAGHMPAEVLPAIASAMRHPQVNGCAVIVNKDWWFCTQPGLHVQAGICWLRREASTCESAQHAKLNFGGWLRPRRRSRQWPLR